MSLLYAFPQPVPVEAPTDSGLVWTVLPFRLIDLAVLEGWICRQAGHPLEGERVRLRLARLAAEGNYWSDEPENLAYLRIIQEFKYLRDFPGCWPPDLFSDIGQELIRSPEGKVEFLHLLVSRTMPGWDRENLTPIVEHMDWEAWLALEAVAYDRHPGDEISRMMDAPEAGEFSWSHEIFKLMDYFKCPDFSVIGNLYLSQWTLIRSGGEYVPGSMRGSDHWQGVMGPRRAEALEKAERLFGTNGDGGHVEH